MDEAKSAFPVADYGYAATGYVAKGRNLKFASIQPYCGGVSARTFELRAAQTGFVWYRGFDVPLRMPLVEASNPKPPQNYRIAGVPLLLALVREFAATECKLRKRDIRR